jgi:hypothetical protein
MTRPVPCSRIPTTHSARPAEVRASAGRSTRRRISVSALDPVNEAAVHDGIERLMAGRTVVLVAHRMRTVRRADHVVFLDGGRIVEQGSPDELLRLGGRYAAFWELATASATDAAS